MLVYTISVYTGMCSGLKALLFFHFKMKIKHWKTHIWWWSGYPKKMFWKVMTVFDFLTNSFQGSVVYTEGKKRFFFSKLFPLLKYFIEYGFSNKYSILKPCNYWFLSTVILSLLRTTVLLLGCALALGKGITQNR